jgi:predicted ester cyclase
MSQSSRKALFKQFVEEIFHRGNLGAVDRYFTPDARIADPGVEMRGPKALVPALKGLLTAFPDLRITVEDQLEEGDRLAVRYRGEATHRVAWRGIPARGTRIGYTGILIVRFERGRIAEYWAQPDLLGLLQQLDAIRIVGQPEAVTTPTGP